MGGHKKVVLDKDSPTYKIFKRAEMLSIVNKKTADLKMSDLDKIIREEGYQYVTFRELELTKRYLEELYILATDNAIYEEESTEVISVRYPSYEANGYLGAIINGNLEQLMLSKGTNIDLTEVTTHLEDRDKFIGFYKAYATSLLGEMVSMMNERSFYNGSFKSRVDRVYREYSEIHRSWDGLRTMLWLTGKEVTIDIHYEYFRVLRQEVIKNDQKEDLTLEEKVDILNGEKYDLVRSLNRLGENGVFILEDVPKRTYKLI